jgi:hypothetical protein
MTADGRHETKDKRIKNVGWPYGSYEASCPTSRASRTTVPYGHRLSTGSFGREIPCTWDAPITVVIIM